MDKHQITTCLESPLQLFATGDKHHLSHSSKVKNTSASTNRRGNQCSQKIIQRVKKLSHTFKNNTLRKNKSKCWTQTHQSIKKRHTETQTQSKKTLHKRKPQKLEHELTNKLKLSYSKNDEQSLTLKSSNNGNLHANTTSHTSHPNTNTNNNNNNNKRNWNKKQMFHSTCFSRHLDQDLELLESMVHVQVGRDGNQRDGDVSGHRSMYSGHFDGVDLGRVIERTRVVLDSYQSKCVELERSCNYYRSQLSQARKKIEQLQRKSSTTKPSNKTKQKQSTRSTNGLKSQKKHE